MANVYGNSIGKVLLYMMILIVLALPISAYNGTAGHGVSLTSTGTNPCGLGVSSNIQYGVNFTPSVDVTVYTATKYPTSDAQAFTIYKASTGLNVTGALYGNGLGATVSKLPHPIVLNATESYYLMNDVLVIGNWNTKYLSISPYPIINNTFGKWTHAIKKPDAGGFTGYTNCVIGMKWFNVFYNTANFSLTAKDNFSGLTIFNFTVNISNSTNTYIFYSNTSTGVILTNFSRTELSLFNITFSSENYQDSYYYDVNTSSDLEGFLNPYNTLYLTIRDESTNNLITENISITFFSNETEFNNITNTGFISYSQLANGIYTIIGQSVNYSNRTFTVIFNNSGVQELTIYLAKDSDEVLFTLYDLTSGDVLEDVSFSMYRFINGSFKVVESGYTDITGRIIFHYINDVNYKFIASKNDYETKTFFLVPKFASYDVRLSRAGNNYDPMIYEGVTIVYNPKIFYSNAMNNFSFSITSLDGILVSYGFNISYPNQQYNFTGGNLYGESWDINFSIPIVNIYDTVNISIAYKTSIDSERQIFRNYEILGAGIIGNYTVMSNKDNTYGLGAFERVLVATFIIIFVAGIGGMVAGSLAGLSLALILMGAMVYIGFVPLWSMIISLLVGFIIIAWRSSL